MRVLKCQPPEVAASEIQIGAEVDIAGALATAAFTLADARVLELHPDLLPARARTFAIAAGEECKSLRTLEDCLRRLAAVGVDRHGTVLALGGGTVGDLGGLTASLWLRGVRLVQVPTTLLAMLDSSVGGKTAVNLPEGKNLVGTVWPAATVLIRPGFVDTLEAVDYRSGLGEALKIAIGFDAELFAFMAEHRDAVLARDHDAVTHLIHRAVAAKIAVVEIDPLERGPRRCLNLGHTLGHALEAHSGWREPHGHAVARGIHFALAVAHQRGAIDDDARHRCTDLLEAYGFAAGPLPARADLLPFLARDKKTAGGDLHFVVPDGIGTCHAEPIALDDLAQSIGR